jgi:hypothetical protein
VIEVILAYGAGLSKKQALDFRLQASGTKSGRLEGSPFECLRFGEGRLEACITIFWLGILRRFLVYIDKV